MRFFQSVLVRSRPARRGEVNYPLVDRFTLIHFGIGCIYGVLGFRFGLAAAMAVFWELIENPLKVYAPSVFPHATADSAQNMIGDVFAVLFGWWLISL